MRERISCVHVSARCTPKMDLINSMQPEWLDWYSILV